VTNLDSKVSKIIFLKQRHLSRWLRTAHVGLSRMLCARFWQRIVEMIDRLTCTGRIGSPFDGLAHHLSVRLIDGAVTLAVNIQASLTHRYLACSLGEQARWAVILVTTRQQTRTPRVSDFKSRLLSYLGYFTLTKSRTGQYCQHDWLYIVNSVVQKLHTRRRLAKHARKLRYLVIFRPNQIAQPSHTMAQRSNQQ
jgi:hypothetical protein